MAQQAETPKLISIRVSPDAIGAAEKTYGAKVTGCQVAVEGFFEIQRRTLEELRGVFTGSELSAIADNMNGVALTRQYQARPEMLWAHLEDGELYEGLFGKWGIDATTFRPKVLALTAAQCYLLQEEAHLFWYGGDKTGIKYLKDFISKFE